jgi:hypothetical protein
VRPNDDQNQQIQQIRERLLADPAFLAALERAAGVSKTNVQATPDAARTPSLARANLSAAASQAAVAAASL